VCFNHRGSVASDFKDTGRYRGGFSGVESFPRMEFPKHPENGRWSLFEFIIEEKFAGALPWHLICCHLSGRISIISCVVVLYVKKRKGILGQLAGTLNVYCKLLILLILY